MDIVTDFLEQYPDIEVFEVFVPDFAGKLRGKWITRDKLPQVMAGGLKMPVSTHAFDLWGRDVQSWVLEDGDGDGRCDADPNTLGPVPWAERPTGQVMLSLREKDGSPSRLDPRCILRELVQRFAERGMTPVVASEMEFCLYRDERDDRGRPVHSQGDDVTSQLGAGETYSIDILDDNAPLMHEIRDVCRTQNLPVDTLIKENGPSQYEINLHHCPDALLAADQGVLLQRAIRGVAKKHGLRATFMAKPFGDTAGNGMHVHCSVVDSEGRNLFDDGTGAGTPLLRHAIAGTLATMTDCMLLLAPNLNSYRRFQRASNAPMAPTWGYENRTVAVRVPADRPEATRIEHRVAGADAQLHLALAAVLAGMLHGIEKELDPGEPLQGNAYDRVSPSLPRHWPEALQQFRQSAFIAEYLGSRFQQVYTIVKESEMEEFDRFVTPLEYAACL